MYYIIDDYEFIDDYYQMNGTNTYVNLVRDWREYVRRVNLNLVVESGPYDTFQTAGAGVLCWTCGRISVQTIMVQRAI